MDDDVAVLPDGLDKLDAWSAIRLVIRASAMTLMVARATAVSL